MLFGSINISSLRETMTLMTDMISWTLLLSILMGMVTWGLNPTTVEANGNVGILAEKNSDRSIAATTAWNKTYGGVDRDRAFSMIQTSDSGYLLAGETMSFGAGGLDSWLVKVDSYGHLQWNRTYGGTDHDVAVSVVQTNDGGYAFAGATKSSGAGEEDFWLVKVDSYGHLQWNRTYGEPYLDIAYSLQQTSDGGFIVAGETSPPYYEEFLVIKTDSSGNMQWNKTYGGYPGFHRARTVQETIDGGYAIAGGTTSGDGHDFWLIKIDLDGNIQWNKTYGGPGSDFAYSMVQTIDGGYALSGFTKTYGVGGGDYWLVRTDSSGNVLWNKTFGGDLLDVAYSLQQTSDGGFIVAGETASFGAGSYDLWVVKTDPNGTAQWNQTYGGTNSDRGFSVVEPDDVRFVVAGTTQSFGAGDIDFWLIAIALDVHDIAVTGVELTETVTNQGSSVPINITIENRGGYIETFNITLYANTTIIGEFGNVTLIGGDSLDVDLIWNTSGFFKGDYLIIAIATPVSSETNIENNLKTANHTVFVLASGHDVAIRKFISKTIVGHGCFLDGRLVVMNVGSHKENLNATVYVNGTSIFTDTFNLTSGASATIDFNWSTTSVIKGNYSINAYVLPLLSETDLTDNNHTGWFIVAMVGDITGPDGWPDGECDMRDVGLVARHFGKNVPPAPANCDLTGPVSGVSDGTIDMRDVGLVARHFGETDP